MLAQAGAPKAPNTKSHTCQTKGCVFDLKLDGVYLCARGQLWSYFRHAGRRGRHIAKCIRGVSPILFLSPNLVNRGALWHWFRSAIVTEPKHRGTTLIAGQIRCWLPSDVAVLTPQRLNLSEIFYICQVASSLQRWRGRRMRRRHRGYSRLKV